MGVFRMQRFIRGNLPEQTWKVQGVEGSFSLLWDMNGLFYDVANDVFGLGDTLDGIPFQKRTSVKTARFGVQLGRNEYYVKDQLPPGIKEIRTRYENDRESMEREFIETVIETMEIVILAAVQPTDVLILAVDGIAPRAKQNQQRMRRFEGASSRHEKTSRALIGSKEEEKSLFNILNFTVGMPLLRRLCEAIDDWIIQNTDRLPRFIKFSGCNEAGEGEHKMFHIFQHAIGQLTANFPTEYKSVEDVFRSKSNVVLGKDSDLLFLSLLRSNYPFYWVREYNGALKRPVRTIEAIDLTDVRNFVAESMGTDPNDKDEVAACMIDFVLMSFFIGDDFVPAMFTITLDNNETLVKMMEAYKSFYSGQRLAPRGVIDLNVFKQFLVVLVDLEKELYEYRVYVDNVELEYKRRVEQHTELGKIDEERTKIRDKCGASYGYEYEPSPILKELSYDEACDMWMHAIACPAILSGHNPKVDKYRQICINRAPDLVNDTCYDYFCGLQWNLLYYLGYQMNNWSYDKPLAPFIFHLSTFVNTMDVQIPNMLRQQFDERLSPTQTLLTVVNLKLSSSSVRWATKTHSAKSPQTENAFNKTLAKAIVNVDNFGAYHPTNFYTFFEGRYWSPSQGRHSGIVFVPHIPLPEMLKITEIANVAKNGIPGGVVIPEDMNMDLLITNSRNTKLLTYMTQTGPSVKIDIEETKPEAPKQKKQKSERGKPKSKPKLEKHARENSRNGTIIRAQRRQISLNPDVFNL